jgi:uncharacterized protein YcaQ
MTPVELDLATARRLAVAAQGLDRTTSNPGAVFGVVKCIQVDSIAAVRRSHELVALARGVDPADASRLGTQEATVETFEGWAHAASLIPLSFWPVWGLRHRRVKRLGWKGPQVDQNSVEHARARLRAEGPLTLTDFGGASGTGWERASPMRWALEWLQKTGEVTVRYRRRWKRVYVLAEQVIPASLLNTDLDDTECLHTLVRAALDALGVATTEDIADYFRLPTDLVEAALCELEIPQAKVAGWETRAWITPDASTCPERTPGRVVPLSPFDSLIWHRPRQRGLFGKPWLLEAYKPPAKREFGYYGMPVLAGHNLAGRIAARRTGNTLSIEAVEWDHTTASSDDLDAAVDTLRRWAGASHLHHHRPRTPQPAPVR